MKLGGLLALKYCQYHLLAAKTEFLQQYSRTLHNPSKAEAAVS